MKEHNFEKSKIEVDKELKEIQLMYAVAKNDKLMGNMIKQEINNRA